MNKLKNNNIIDNNENNNKEKINEIIIKNKEKKCIRCGQIFEYKFKDKEKKEIILENNCIFHSGKIRTMGKKLFFILNIIIKNYSRYIRY